MSSYRKSISAARRALALILGICLLGIHASCERSVVHEPGRTVILLVVDTWRGDHLLDRRAGAELTPNLAVFAESAEQFRDASSSGNCTSAGTAGVLTGLYPHRSSVDRNRSMLPAELPTIATLLRARGFRTAAFVGNPVLRPGMGFENGFAHYEWVRTSEGQSKTRAAELLTAAAHWLDGVAPHDSVLIWMQFMEPHGPYQPPAELSKLFPASAFGEPRTVDLLPYGNNTGLSGIPYYQHAPLDSDMTDVRRYLAAYAAEVRAVDEAISLLFEDLDRRGRLRDAVIILTSDHGEALENDHGYYFSHANGLSVDQLHVPLMLRFPGCKAGSQSDLPVSTIDILPTLLGLLAIENVPDLDGTDLRDPSPRRLMSQHFEEVAVRQGPWRLTRTASGQEYLFDLRQEEGRELERGQIPTAVLAQLRTALDEEVERPALGIARLRPPMRRTPGGVAKDPSAEGGR